MRYRLVLGFLFVFSCSDAGTDDALVIIGDEESGFIDPETGEPIVNDAPDLLEFASVGTRCNSGQSKEFVVLSDAPVSCESHAAAIDAKIAGESLQGLVVLESDALMGDHSYCADGESCDDIAFEVELESDRGSWSAVIDGVKQVQRFDLSPCAYDSALPPFDTDAPARNISITEVALYQAIKIPLIQSGEAVVPNAPIIAGRPGIFRVFVTPSADWDDRTIKARLKMGDLVKEEDFTATRSSIETDGRSTINFAFEAGELEIGMEFSVELLETESCGEVTGETYDWRAPATGTQSLGARSLSKPLEIVLVPVRYNADGSGRTPAMGESELARYRDIAYSYYPVAEISVTARQVVDYNQPIQPNGAGFGEFLNWCLNLRYNDNVDRDVYYYCLASPADSYRQFCGRGCVAGIAPVPSASDWTSRGGIGVAFAGAGEDTFVHEVGHALGRPHSPCGGAQGVARDYPNSDGSIGVWGYHVTSGSLIDPSAKDFMGYCEPSWVSDFTYAGLFARLSFVLDTQSVEVSTAPTRYRTAVLDIDGKLKLGNERVMTHLPTGSAIDANWATTGRKANVWVTPIADIDAALVTFEDPGYSGAQIELPGLGVFSLD